MPIHFALLLVKEFIDSLLYSSSASARAAVTVGAQVDLLCGSFETRLSQFLEVIHSGYNTYKLKGCDAMIKNIRTSALQNLTISTTTNSSRTLALICDDILTIASGNLAKREELDNQIEVEKRRLITDSKQVQRMIEGEEDKRRIAEDAKKLAAGNEDEDEEEKDFFDREAIEIQQTFNRHSKAYEHLLQSDLTIQEKLDHQQKQRAEEYGEGDNEDEEYSSETPEKFEELPRKQLDEIKARANRCVIEILHLFDDQLSRSKDTLFAEELQAASSTIARNHKEHSILHKLEYIKLSIIKNVSATATSKSLLQVLESTAVLGHIASTNSFSDCFTKTSATAINNPLDASAKVTFNVYKDVIPGESVRIFAPVMNLLKSIRRLLHDVEVFEDNFVLQNLAMLCDFTLEQAVLNTPLNKIITGL